MLEISNVEIAGWKAALRGMRNPKNSWERSDSKFDVREYEYPDDLVPISVEPISMGPNDLKLANALADGGPVHAKYRRMIVVWLDINAPLYWWKEFDTYKVGTVANSCSTMHKIHDRDMTLKDFSHERMTFGARDMLAQTICELNDLRRKFVETKDKAYWDSLIQLLPTSYNQKRTVMLSYEVLANIYRWRRNHKLDEWHTFCDWVESLPYSELITGKR